MFDAFFHEFCRHADHFTRGAVAVKRMAMELLGGSGEDVSAGDGVSVWTAPLADSEKPVLNSSPMVKLQLQHVDSEAAKPTKPTNVSDDQGMLMSMVLKVLKHNHNRFPWNTWTCMYQGCFNLMDDKYKNYSPADMQENFQCVIDLLRHQRTWLKLRTNPDQPDWKEDNHYQFFIEGNLPEVPVDKVDRSDLNNAWSVHSLLQWIHKSKDQKPGFNTPISLLRAIHFFPGRTHVPQNVGNVAMELATFSKHFELVPTGPYVFNCDSDVIVRIKDTEEIRQYLADHKWSITSEPGRSWAKQDVQVYDAGGDAIMTSPPMPVGGAGGLAAPHPTDHWRSSAAPESTTVQVAGGSPCTSFSETGSGKGHGKFVQDPSKWIDYSGKGPATRDWGSSGQSSQATGSGNRGGGWNPAGGSTWQQHKQDGQSWDEAKKDQQNWRSQQYGSGKK
jgi:hypothetical protein